MSEQYLNMTQYVAVHLLRKLQLGGDLCDITLSSSSYKLIFGEIEKSTCPEVLLYKKNFEDLKLALRVYLRSKEDFGLGKFILGYFLTLKPKDIEKEVALLTKGASMCLLRDIQLWKKRRVQNCSKGKYDIITTAICAELLKRSRKGCTK
ncbi:MAG: hypothetical protein ACRCYY_20815 [Trueperaceae bacterium]